MIIRYWPALLAFLLAAFLVTIPTGCATQQEPVTEEQPAETTEMEAEEEPVYTRNDPGAWEGKESSHIPVITYEKTETGLTVTVTVNHVMDAEIPHYIEWVKLWDGEGNLLGEAAFEATDKTARATFEITSVPTKLVAHERCNVHGIWMEEVPVT
jgi:superoxide reductase